MSIKNNQTKIGETEKALGPVVQFLGHALAAALGFIGLALISLLPIGAIHLIKKWGDVGLADSLHWLEITLLYVDIGLFSAVMLAGIVVFLAELFVETKTRIMQITKPRTP